MYDTFSGRMFFDFSTPTPVTAMAFDPNGQLWVAGASAIHRFDPFDGVEKFPPIEPLELRQPWGLAIGEDGNVYATSTDKENDTHEILRFDLEGNPNGQSPSSPVFVPNAKNGGLNDPRDLVSVRVRSLPPTLYVASFAATSGVQGVLEYDGDTGEFKRVLIRPPVEDLAG